MERRLIVTDICGQPIGPTFKGQALSLKMAPDRLCRNVGKLICAGNIPDVRKSNDYI